MSPCRLHISDFSLSSLKRHVSEDIDGTLEFSPSDLALLTSPNLDAIALSGTDFSCGVSDYKFEAIAELVARSLSGCQGSTSQTIASKGLTKS